MRWDKGSILWQLWLMPHLAWDECLILLYKSFNNSGKLLFQGETATGFENGHWAHWGNAQHISMFLFFGITTVFVLQDYQLKIILIEMTLLQALRVSWMSSIFTKSICHQVSTTLQLSLRLVLKGSYLGTTFMAGLTWTWWFVRQYHAHTPQNTISDNEHVSFHKFRFIYICSMSSSHAQCAWFLKLVTEKT